MTNRISPTIFGIVLILFFLPWINISCGGQKVFTFSGTDLAIGKTMEVPQAFGPVKKENARDGRATIAFLAGLAGVAAGVWGQGDRAKKMISAISGAVGGVFLYLVKSKLDNEIVAQGAGMITVDYQIGFWGAMLLFFAACAWNVLSLTNYEEKTPVNAGPRRLPESSPISSFCTQCGSKISPDEAYCSECGHPLK